MRPLILIPIFFVASFVPAAAMAETVVERDVAATIEQYYNKLREIGPRLAKAQSEDERATIRSSAPKADEVAPKILKLALDHPDDPGAVKAICWLIVQAAGYPESAKALELLGSRYVTSAGVWEAAQQLHRLPPQQAEPILKAIIEKNPHVEDQCAATHALATLYFNQSENVLTPEAKATREEAKRLFQEVAAKFPSVTLQGFKPADQSAALLFEMENLAVGCTTPEIEGKDAHGKSFKLSDYRGKVVVLVFWGAWCHSCHYFLPQLRELNTKMQGQSFAIVGVNSDLPAELQSVLAKENIPWRNFADESSTGSISTVWNIRNWPTIYVLDAEGVIRAKNPGAGALEQIARPLLPHAGQKG